MTMVGLLLALLTPWLDQRLADWTDAERQWFHASAESAQATLSWISTTLITVACVVLSMTVVALTQTTSQFGSRLLRNFMTTNATQMALGTIFASVVYCLLVQKSVDIENGFVPHVSVIIGMAAAIASLGMVFFFIHSVAESIQAQNVVEHVGAELDEAIEAIYPQSIGERPEAGDFDGTLPDDVKAAVANLGEDFAVIKSRHEGYLLAVDADALMHAVKASDTVVRVLVRPGDFVIRRQPLAQLWRATDQDQIDKLDVAINAACVAGQLRTPRQDIECAVNELVEVAVRALSPGINDPFTAITCIDRFSASLSRLAGREIPHAIRCDEDQKIRVIAEARSFAAVADAAFNQIRQAAQGLPAVGLRLLECLVVIAGSVRRLEDHKAIRRHAEMVQRSCLSHFDEVLDRQDAQQRYDRVLAALNQQPVLEPASRDRD